MRLARLTIAAALTLSLAACADSPAERNDASIDVTAGLYPLAFVAREVGGEHISVTSLAAPGVEPHDLELSPAAVRSLGQSNLVLHIGGFQPAVDAAIDSTEARAIDAATALPLRDAPSGEGIDPHFWLEPGMLSKYAKVLSAEFARLDPENADAYAANAATLAGSLEGLHQRYLDGLEQCERRELITTHEAFQYLAVAYGLEQVGIAGTDPDAEPSPARIREISDLVAASGATTIFAESDASKAVAESVARDAGVEVAVLSPLETVADGEDYFSIMERNLETIRKALDCD